MYLLVYRPNACNPSLYDRHLLQIHSTTRVQRLLTSACRAHGARNSKQFRVYFPVSASRLHEDAEYDLTCPTGSEAKTPKRQFTARYGRIGIRDGLIPSLHSCFRAELMAGTTEKRTVVTFPGGDLMHFWSFSLRKFPVSSSRDANGELKVPVCPQRGTIQILLRE
ncbi:hypothetical protein BJ508DRAFT_43701 [Ascobolus immersus RN42]|uniref:Uncharacterized protein n=1 Tax=Ascobolus immersus RN42 TaxID=1160509 RepID=A0A3N4IDQ0_ASCIM|nr:hypothetical protein BJ508DRAFT_43701 [Ascobolus immersus RN42]